MIPANSDQDVEIAIVGAGIAGIAVAYYLCVKHKRRSVLLIDSRQPMSYTSAQSGDNYRNWWPHRTMVDFINDSIDEMDRLAQDSNNIFHMSRAGYVLTTRQIDVANIVDAIAGDIDVGVINGRNAIRAQYPYLSAEINNVIHIRRGGDISGQQLGQYLLGKLRAVGGKRMQGQVTSIHNGARYCLEVTTRGGVRSVDAAIVVNAAGPFVNVISRMLGVELPVTNIYQQKIAFEDQLKAVPRDMPFCIDLDAKQLGWTAEEKSLLAEDKELDWLTAELPPGTHCRPDGGPYGKWVKLGWAYNNRVSEARDELADEPAIDSFFPEIVMRGAAAFIPGLLPYVASPPVRYSHYGGYYTMTDENWPLIGPLDNNAAFVVAALSGFGSMAACAAGKLCAAHICGGDLPSYAGNLSMARLTNKALMVELAATSNKGLL